MAGRNIYKLMLVIPFFTVFFYANIAFILWTNYKNDIVTKKK